MIVLAADGGLVPLLLVALAVIAYVSPVISPDTVIGELPPDALRVPLKLSSSFALTV